MVNSNFFISISLRVFTKKKYILNRRSKQSHFLRFSNRIQHNSTDLTAGVTDALSSIRAEYFYYRRRLISRRLYTIWDETRERHPEKKRADWSGQSGHGADSDGATVETIGGGGALDAALLTQVLIPSRNSIPGVRR